MEKATVQVPSLETAMCSVALAPAGFRLQNNLQLIRVMVIPQRKSHPKARCWKQHVVSARLQRHRGDTTPALLQGEAAPQTSRAPGMGTWLFHGGCPEERFSTARE